LSDRGGSRGVNPGISTTFHWLSAASMTLILSPFLNGSHPPAFPIPQHLLSDVILNSSDPAALGVPPDQIATVALLDSFSSTTLGIADHIILSQGR
jgi:hypothetical protein